MRSSANRARRDIGVAGADGPGQRHLLRLFIEHAGIFRRCYLGDPLERPPVAADGATVRAAAETGFASICSCAVPGAEADRPICPRRARDDAAA